MRLKIGAAMVSACVIPVLAATPALADSWSGTINGPGGGASGKIKVGIGKVSQSWTVIDTKSDGKCAQFRVIIDLPGFPDRNKDSRRACGNQKVRKYKNSFNESKTMSGVKLQMCSVHSDGSDRHCETKKYVKSDKD
ncbi:hypothetical protein HCC61_22900 [Streptomyces sp. HNM0575]|uniref:hypothetical protein n=1 Tax=Streptomyces sp. HNM0575 TaxID=2716338 RepID=UPI00145D5187|nr:hypothetical protein [Streptomyces sp. HNM0575]NLU75481.1 hypothetical protein [Streptomyces sp. HNM0575]